MLKFFSAVNTPEQKQKVQRDIISVEKWAVGWKMYMYFNTQKCKHLHLGKDENIATYMMHPENNELAIQKVTSEKDLGVIVDNKLLFREHMSTKVATANKVLGLIFRTFTYMDQDMFVSLYKSLVRPHLEYATPVWTPLYKKDSIALENVQRRATRLVSSLSTLTYQERLVKLGLPSLEYRRFRADVIEVYEIFEQNRFN